MSADLILRTSCGGCGSTSDLYGSNCKHMTLCVSCGKKMAETRTKCFECGSPVTRLIREYNVRASTVNEKNYFIGRFVTGLPTFWRKKNAENKWSLHKDGLQGRQLSETLREKYKNRPWVLEDESGQSQYQGHLEGAQTATYYLLMMQGKEFTAIPAGSWFNFNKVAQYKQLTLEEAEEKIKNRKKTADGYERWMMKAANTGPAAFGEVDRFDKDNGGTGGRGRKKISGGDDDDDEANLSDKGDDDDDEGLGRRSKLNKRGGDDDDDEGGREIDAELDDDIEKGDDWEHEEIFTDDDEAVGNDADEREDEPDVAAPETKDDDDDDDDDEDDVEDGLTKDGKEIKKLLRKKDGLNGTEAEKPPGRAGGSDAEEDDDDDDDEMDDDIGIPQALAPKHKDAVKEEPSDSTSSKAMPSGSAKGTPPSSKSTKGKRKLNSDDAKVSNNAPPKKVKSENASVKEEPGSASKSSVPPKGTASVKKESTSSAVTSAGSVPVKPVTEEEIRAVLTSGTPVTTQDLVARFRARLKTPADKAAFAEILKRISKIHKSGGNGFVVLR